MPVGQSKMGRSWWRGLTECGPLEEENGKPLHYSCLENPMNSMKRQNDRILKEELPRSIGTQHATGDQWRNNSRKNEGMEPKQKQYPAADVTGDRSKVQCCKEKYCISSVQLLSRVRLFATHESQHARPPCPSPSPGVHSDSRPSSQ